MKDKNIEDIKNQFRSQKKLFINDSAAAYVCMFLCDLYLSIDFNNLLC